MNTHTFFTKKTIVSAVTALSLGFLAPLAISTDALAQNGGGFSGPNAQGHGGFSGPGPAITTIKEASNMPDDSWATLRGHIIRHEGKDVYTFRDASGEGKIEIDHDVWRGQHIGPQDTVEILVEIDKDWGYVEMEAEQIRKVK